MFKIEAAIRPSRLFEVKEALVNLGVPGMTVTNARGHGRQKGHTNMYRGVEYSVDLIPRLWLMLVVRDHQKDKAVAAIQQWGCTGRIGDGKVLVTKIDYAVRIRTGEIGPAAL